MNKENYVLIKRFLENFKADPLYKEAYIKSPKEFLKQIELEIDPKIIEEILTNTQKKESVSSNIYLREIQIREQKIAQEYRDYFSSRSIIDQQFVEWRERQISRIKANFPVSFLEQAAYFSFAYELSDGCSGQCNFCCFDPKPFKSAYLYTKENAITWQEILAISKKIIGDHAKFAACYFATEPLDNPDYEKFVSDFYAIYGRYPQLTTTKYLEEAKRIKHYLKVNKLQPWDVRFSITSLQKLRKMYELYSLEELANIELVLNNWESVSHYANAGRARKLFEKLSLQGDLTKKISTAGTPVCVTGFLINMVHGSIKLISSCNPDDENPFGYIQFDEVFFKNTKEYQEQLLDLISRNMPKTPFENHALSFSTDFKIEKFSNGVKFVTPYLSKEFRGDKSFLALVDLIVQKKCTWQEIEKQFNNIFLTEFYLKPKLQQMYDMSILILEK